MGPSLCIYEDLESPGILQCDGRDNPKGLRLLAAIINAKVKHNDTAGTSKASAVPVSDLALAFSGGPAETRMTPEVRVGQMLECIQIMEKYSGCCYVLAGIYLDRFMRSRQVREAELVLKSSTVHRIVTVALRLAAKYHHRRVDTFHFPACSEGIPAKEINHLEMRFLRAINFRQNVIAGEFHGSCAMLEYLEASSGSRKRKAETYAGEVVRRVRPLVACRETVLCFFGTVSCSFLFQIKILDSCTDLQNFKEQLVSKILMQTWRYGVSCSRLLYFGAPTLGYDRRWSLSRFVHLGVGGASSPVSSMRWRWGYPRGSRHWRGELGGVRVWTVRARRRGVYCNERLGKRKAAECD